jgi:gamma-glutamyltranspeptidase/glutathione hydrolase
VTLSRADVMMREPRDAAAADVDPYPPREVVMARRGLVASAHPFASQVGLEVLRHGGNAVDAAVAAAAVLTVVEPRNGHLGGDTFMQINLAGSNRVVALNGSGAAPAAATLERYRELGGIPEDGLLTSTVPGTVSCWALALECYGSRPLGELLQPAISYADEGVPVTARLHRLLSADAAIYRMYPDTARVFLPGGEVPLVGSTLRQPDLARSLRRIAEGGRDEFYLGALADEMVRASERYGGLFTREDFAAHRSEELEPVSTTHRGYTVYEQPPVSQGLVVLLALNILARFDLAATGPGSTETLHLLIEATKLAFEDRLRYLGDPWFCCDMPLAWLLSEEHTRDQAARIDRRRARSLPESLPALVDPDTTSIVVVDKAGTMVSYIHSLFAGSGVVLGETGVLMNSRLRGFTLDERSPNCLAPGKRPIHTLNTYVVHEDGEPVLVGGTPGAHWQVQTNLQVLTNVLDFGMDLESAVQAPRFTIGDQLATGSPMIKLESRLGGRVVEELRAMGHAIEVIGPWASGGAVQLVARDRSGLYRGATDARRVGGTIAAM